jgi:hypothetical protein
MSEGGEGGEKRRGKEKGGNEMNEKTRLTIAKLRQKIEINQETHDRTSSNEVKAYYKKIINQLEERISYLKGEK